MFVVICSTSIPNHLHGYLSRFLCQADVGVYVGKISARVRDALWERCKLAISGGSMVMISSNGDREQGYSIATLGPERRHIVDLDGLQLVSTLEAKLNGSVTNG